MSRFLIGAATAAHQVEGNNIYNDIWAQEQMKTGGYPEKSGAAANHYVTYAEDIKKMKDAGLNAYRFSLEWSRIEPEEGKYNAEAVEHYRDVIRTCRKNGIEPVVTLFHFSSPKWLIEKYGWEDMRTAEVFEGYARFVCDAYKEENLSYICTINEANIGVLIAKYMRMAMEQARKERGALAIGVDVDAMNRMAKEQEKENLEVFGRKDPAFFVAPRTEKGIEVVKEAHRRAVCAIHELLPGTKAGLSLSLNDLQWNEEGEAHARQLWQSEFEQFQDALVNDDYFGLQNYTRSIIGKDGELPVAEGREVTQMGYEYYPEGLEHIVRRVYGELKKEILITENGIATSNDQRRIAFIEEALAGVEHCIKDGIPLIGYLHWSLIDNYEWQSGYSMQFGLIANDASHSVKESLAFLGTCGSRLLSFK